MQCTHNVYMNRRITKVERRDYPCWFIVEPAPDVAGNWVAHCLEFDTLSQAEDPATAIKLLLESTTQIVLDDLCADADPLERRAPADDDGWALLRFVSEQPSRRVSTFEELSDIANRKANDRDVVIAAQFFLRYERSVPSSHLASSPARGTLFQSRERMPQQMAV